MEVTEYIKQHWNNTIMIPQEHNSTVLNIPKPYSVPCTTESGGFTDFYYWDTYFANLGLMLDGRVEQAENNLDIMDHFIGWIGYMPNASHLLERSQPPLFTRGVWDLYQFTGRVDVIEKYMPSMLAEYRFFLKDRMTKVGLNQYASELNRSRALLYYPIFSERINEVRETEEEQITLVRDLMAIAESGWDFTPRFNMPERRYAAGEFAPLDLNCLLYDVEWKIAEMSERIGETAQAKCYRTYAEERKERMLRYMVQKDTGIFYDYNFVQDTFSSVASAASFYPYVVGLSNDRQAAEKLLGKLELDYGLSACESRGEDAEYLQWDYPCMWPSNVYFAYEGLRNIGMTEDADRIAKKYLQTVEHCFAQTGALWEKYDASTGKISVTSEYETPEMMGWTAGVYQYLYHQVRKGNENGR